MAFTDYDLTVEAEFVLNELKKVDCEEAYENEEDGGVTVDCSAITKNGEVVSQSCNFPRPIE